VSESSAKLLRALGWETVRVTPFNHPPRFHATANAIRCSSTFTSLLNNYLRYLTCSPCEELHLWNQTSIPWPRYLLQDGLHTVVVTGRDPLAWDETVLLPEDIVLPERFPIRKVMTKGYT